MKLFTTCLPIYFFHDYINNVLLIRRKYNGRSLAQRLRAYFVGRSEKIKLRLTDLNQPYAKTDD